MRTSAWDRLLACESGPKPERWIESVLERNADCEYLRRYGSPRSLAAFRANLPTITYDDLGPWMARIEEGRPDVLFAGRPVAFERTAGNSGGAKLIPYSPNGLADFRRSIVPWLRDVVYRHGIEGSAYFSISPALRTPQFVGGVPVGMPDGAYLGDAAAAVLSEVTAVPLEIGALADVSRWRSDTLRFLAAAHDLEMISVWSPTFLLRLLEDLPAPCSLWPRLKLISCWASGPSEPFADELARRLPHARLQPKGLLSTETVVTVPDSSDRPRLTPHGFFEFERLGKLYQADELEVDDSYEVIATTASGLYRYRTGDVVRCTGRSSSPAPILEFVGRGDLVCDLVGEKLSDRFAAECLGSIGGCRFLVPEASSDGYVLAVETGLQVNVEQIEERLHRNPQYAYARTLGQLKPLRLCHVERLFDRYSTLQINRGIRIGDVKPLALLKEPLWGTLLGLTR